MSRKMHWPGAEDGRGARMFRAVGILGFLSLALFLLLALNPAGLAQANGGDDVKGCFDFSTGKDKDPRSFNITVNPKCGDFGNVHYGDDDDDDGPYCYSDCGDDDDDDGPHCYSNCGDDDDDDGPHCSHNCGDDDDDDDGPHCSHNCGDDDDDNDNDDDNHCDGYNDPSWCHDDCRNGSNWWNKDDRDCRHNDRCNIDDAIDDLPSNVEIVSIDSDDCTIVVKQKTVPAPPAPIIIQSPPIIIPQQQPIIIQQAAPAPTAVAAAVGGQTIAPPKTGDAGLAAHTNSNSSLPFAGLAVVLGFIGLSAATFAYAKKER